MADPERSLHELAAHVLPGLERLSEELVDNKEAPTNTRRAAADASPDPRTTT